MVAGLVCAAACGGSSSTAKHSARPTAPGATTTPTTAAPRRLHWPLTGVPTSDRNATTRPALTVKIDNIAVEDEWAVCKVGRSDKINERPIAADSLPIQRAVDDLFAMAI